MPRILIIAGLMAVSGCASIIEGSSQEIVINTTPAGARCGFYRQGNRFTEVPDTPGAVVIKKSSEDITILCMKDGFQPTQTVNKSQVAGAVVGNVLAGGLIGIVVDAATGAGNKYDSPISITLSEAPGQRGTALPAKLP